MSSSVALHGAICGLRLVNDIAIGIALMLFGRGVAFFFGKDYIQPVAPRLRPSNSAGGRGSEPRQALEINPLFLIGLVLAIVMWWGFRTPVSA